MAIVQLFKIKKRLFRLFFLMLFPFFFVTAQKSQDLVKEQEALRGYFELPRESIFLHLNKSTYVVGEDIWFKGYVYNLQQGVPFEDTSNLYVGIYDSKGKQINKNLYLGLNGYAKGSILVDSTLTEGTYYIKAYTNWMRNFKEDGAFVQKIKILSDAPKVKSIMMDSAYDVQFLPEGGNLITGIPNSIGVKITDDRGYGVKIEDAYIINEKNKRITSFDTNKMGHGRFEFTPKRGIVYKAQINLPNREELSFEIPMAQSNGININLKNNPRSNEVAIVIGTNEGTYARIKSEKFFVLLHKVATSERIPVHFDSKTYTASMILDKRTLPPGVNTLTVFNSMGKPVLERMFFNNYNLQNQDSFVSVVESTADTLEVSVKVFPPKQINLSVSVLPELTKSYGHSDNILSSFYLRPYVKGFVENPRYYFTEVNPKKMYELDLLLLTQGWSKYTWNNIMNFLPKPLFEFEDGLTLSGTLNRNISKGDKVLLHSSDYHGSQVINLSEGQNRFKVTNFFPVKGKDVHLSYIDKKGVLSSPGIYLTVSNNIGVDRIDDIWDDKKDEPVKSFGGVNVGDFVKDSKTIELEEVSVVEERRNKKAYSDVSIPAYLKNKVTEVDDEMVRDFLYITDLIRSKGYQVEVGLTFNSLVRIRSRREGGVLLVLDGLRQPNLDVLYQMPTDQIESFFFDRLARYEGAASERKEIFYIYTRKGGDGLDSSFGKSRKKNTFKITMSHGFENSKEFYTPKYITYFDEAFENYGIIHWEPEIITNSRGEATFKILNTGLENHSFFIEGMDGSGNLISTKQILQIDKVD